MSGSLHAALLYRALGFSILPTRGKRPDSDLLSTTSGSRGWGRLRTSPADESEIVAWYERRPGAGVGVMTGRASRLMVADIEASHVDSDVAQKLLSIRTPTATTPSGGYHVYFTASTETPTRRRQPWGDLQGDGAYVVAPSGQPERTWLVGPAEAGFAHFDPVQELLAGSNPLEVITPLEVLPPRGTPSRERADADEAALLDDLAPWDANPLYIGAMLDLLGIRAPLGEKFGCILPGHGPDRDPSASISVVPGSGHVLYRCWQTNKTYTLCQVFYAHVAERPIEKLPWSKSTHAVWKLRSLLETEQTPRPSIVLPCPKSLPASAVAHLPALTRYFEVRELTRMGRAGPLAPKFFGPWCGIGPDAAKELRHVFRTHGVIVKTGDKKKLADLYLPGVAPEEAS